MSGPSCRKSKVLSRRRWLKILRSENDAALKTKSGMLIASFVLNESKASRFAGGTEMGWCKIVAVLIASLAWTVASAGEFNQTLSIGDPAPNWEGLPV